MAEALAAGLTLERFLAGVLEEVILQVEPRLEGLLAGGAAEVPDVLVEGVDVGLQAAGLGKAFVAQLAADLMADPVGAEVVAQRVAVSVLPVAHVALGRLVGVGLLVDGVGRLVGEALGAEVAGEAARSAAGPVGRRRHWLLGVAVQVGEVRVAAHVEPEVAAEVLHVGEAAEAGEADQLLLAPALQLLLGQR